MAHHTIDLGELDLNKFQGLGRIIHQAFDPDGGGGLICDLKVYGSEGSTSFFRWDYSADKCFIQRTTEETSPGRLLYIQHLASAPASGQNSQGLQLRSRLTGTGTIDGGCDGMEIKAGWNSDSDTGTMAGARAIVANIDAKKGTITIARGIEMQVDVKVGGEITTLHGFRASLNNSGTIGTSYAFIVETANTGLNWDYGFYMANNQVDVGMYLGSCTTGIQMAGVQTTGLTIASAVTGINVTTSSTTVLVGNLAVATATGDFNGLEINVTNTVDRTAGHYMKGASINVNPVGSKTTGRIYGMEACVYIGGTTTVNHLVAAVFAEIQGGTTIESDYYSIYAYYNAAASPAGSSAVIRLESNISADNRLDAWIACVGGKGAFLMELGPLAHQTAWESNSGSLTVGDGGWLKISVGAATRYIQLYDTI